MNGTRFSRRRLVALAGVSGATVASAATPLGGFIRPAFAQDLGADATITANAVRLRSEPGLSGRVIAVLGSGEAVRRGDDTFPVDGYNWASVTVKRTGQSGYVATDFLSTDGGGGGASDFPIGSQFVVETANSGAANLRSGPGLSAGVVRVVAAGTVGVIRSGATNANGYRWFEVEIDGSDGFFADLVIAPFDSGSEDPGFDGYPVGSAIVVIDGPLNLRAEPIDGAILAVYQTGSTGTTIDDAQAPATRDGYAWYPVEMSDGKVGWLAADFIGLAGGGGGQSGEVLVVDGPLNVRSTPGGAIVGTVLTGKYGAFTGEPSRSANGYLWVNVRFYGGPSGWVADAFVTY